MKIHLMRFPACSLGTQPIDVENIMSISPVHSSSYRNSYDGYVDGYEFLIYPKIGAPFTFRYDFTSTKINDVYAQGIKEELEKERTKLIEAWSNQKATLV